MIEINKQQGSRMKRVKNRVDVEAAESEINRARYRHTGGGKQGENDFDYVKTEEREQAMIR